MCLRWNVCIDQCENNMKTIVTTNNIKIIDSYKINKKKEMINILLSLKEEYSNCNTFKRSIFSLLCEWKTHNRLYYLGLWKSRTKDVDLNYPLKWYMKILYFICGI